MKIKNIYFDEKARLYMLIESAIFGDRINNRKLGFNGLDTQITFIPSVWSGRKESLEKPYNRKGFTSKILQIKNECLGRCKQD